MLFMGILIAVALAYVLFAFGSWLAIRSQKQDPKEGHRHNRLRGRYSR
jgi:hypothetical protein